jgi:hypothetical protein
MGRRASFFLFGGCLGLLASVSCIDVAVPDAGGLFSGPFIVSGQIELDFENRACTLFRADSGYSYVLFQGPRLTNEEFDDLFQNGARVRLEIDPRDDLEARCPGGSEVEVIEILEVIPPQ